MKLKVKNEKDCVRYLIIHSRAHGTEPRTVRMVAGCSTLLYSAPHTCFHVESHVRAARTLF